MDGGETLSIVTLKDVLCELEIDELLNSSFIENIKILEWNVEKYVFSTDLKRGYVWYIIDGGVITSTYFSGEKELFWELKKGTWTGLPDAILNIYPEHNLKILRGTKVLEIPLYDMLQSDDLSAKLYKKILVEFASTIRPAVKNAAARLKCGDEIFFLKYLENNNYKITFTSLKDLAEILNINLRTFHRILKKLVVNSIIIKKIDSIEVLNPGCVDKYIDNISK